MSSRTASPVHDSASQMDGGVRKRVCKACDRCRLKKSKCDGTTPCIRCKADNAICVFGERKKSHDKVYPKGYVEMLEHQQLQLVAGLQELYRRLLQGQGWTGAPLSDAAHGFPLTHDILDRLGALQPDGYGGSSDFTEDFNTMQQMLLAKGAGYPRRDTSTSDTGSEIDSPLFEPSISHRPAFSNPFAHQLPPTPPQQSPHPTFVKTSSPLKVQTYATPEFSDLTWQTEPVDMDMGFDTYEQTMMDLHMQTLQNAQSQMFQNTATSIDPSYLTRAWEGNGQPHQFYQGGLYT